MAMPLTYAGLCKTYGCRTEKIWKKDLSVIGINITFASFFKETAFPFAKRFYDLMKVDSENSHRNDNTRSNFLDSILKIPV